MRREQYFNKALGISLLIHISILLPLSALSIFSKEIPKAQIHVNYIKVDPKELTVKKDKSAEELDKIGLKQRIVLSREDALLNKGSQEIRQDALKENMLEKVKSLLEKPSLTETRLISKNEINLSLVENSKAESNPVYLNYQNYIRENLRRYLYNKYSQLEERGEVHLTFILNADGFIKDAQIIEAKTNAGKTLRKIVTDSLYAAAPFPPLPAALNTPILSFSVTVHFRETAKK